MSPHLFCFGLGFTAREVIRQNPDWQVTATRRQSGAETTPDLMKVQWVPFNGAEAIDDFAQIVSGVTHILLSIPPAEDGDPVHNAMGKKIAELPDLKWIGYLSTTGVYGNLDGDLATEDTPYNPSGLRGTLRMKAELEWRKLLEDKGLPLHIFRLPGIYGPGRNQMVSLKTGKAHRIEKPGHVFSRIHVEDLAQILSASMNAPDPGRIYNVSDDLAAPPQQVVAYAADLLKMDPPPLQYFDSASMSPMARSFYSDNKRVSNKRIKTELGISLRYPTYKEGLKALMDYE